MPFNRRELRFWQSVAVRLLVVLLAGWLSILWFQGCLIPSTREEMQQNQLKAADSAMPPK
jgi:hypothetical protein